MTTLVFDIETIPDLAGGRKLYHLEDLSDADVFAAMTQLRREKTGQDFLPLHLQKIVAISLVLEDKGQYRVWSLGELESDEKELIKRFFSGLEKYQPTLVSWNGMGFDLPVLHYRALLHGVSAPIYWESGDHNKDFRYNNYLNRYHSRHLDLMDVLAAYQAKAFAPLDEIATLLGFPGKMGMAGSKVYEQYCQGELKAIRDYCETDVLNTYCVYLRFELMRGNFTPPQYQTHLERLISYLTEPKDKPHWQAFTEKMLSTEQCPRARLSGPTHEKNIAGPEAS